MILTALAGPAANILLALLSMILYKLWCYIIYPAITISFTTASAIAQIFYIMCLLNINLAVFNLIPIPPLDGSRIVYIFLPTKIYFGIMKYERYIMIAMLVLLYLGVFNGTIGWVADKIFYGMNWLVTRIPVFR